MQAVKLTFFILFVIFLVNCSSRNKKLDADNITLGAKSYLEGVVSEIPRRWFNTAQRFKLTDINNNEAKHLFWDVNPDINYKSQTLNFIATTTSNSDFHYELDLASGQRFTDKKYCAQKDVWKKYPEQIHRPIFSQGIVPRVLDQQMQPQKIIVFGDEQYYQSNYLENYFDARIIGSFVLQDCPLGACLEQSSWNSRLILVGVQVGNETYNKVKTINDLKKIIDWNYVVAFMENALGRNTITNNVYPAFKVGSIVSPSQAMFFLEKKSKHFSTKDLKNLKISCYRLYDYLWKNLSFEAMKKKEVKNVKNIKIKRFSKKKNKNVNIDLVTKAFYERFILDFKKYHKDFYTCSKYVYNTSINYNLDRYKFFTYFSALSKVYHLGNYYSCERNIWIANPIVEKGKRAVKTNELFNGCDGRDIDIAFESAIDFLLNLNQSNRPSFRYIDYDKGSFGTHNKLYSWVHTSGKLLACEDSGGQSFNNNSSIFPKDVKWKKRDKAVSFDKTSLGKIIE